MYKIANWLWVAFLLAGAVTRDASIRYQSYVILSQSLPPLAILLSMYSPRISVFSKIALVLNTLFGAFYVVAVVLALERGSVSMLATFSVFTLLCVLNAIKAWKLGRTVSYASQDTAL